MNKHYTIKYTNIKSGGEALGQKYVNATATFENGNSMPVTLKKEDVELYMFLQKLESKYKISKQDLSKLDDLMDNIQYRANEFEF